MYLDRIHRGQEHHGGVHAFLRRFLQRLCATEEYPRSFSIGNRF